MAHYKRILVFMVVLALMTSLFAFTASAAEVDTTTIPEETVVVDDSAASGEADDTAVQLAIANEYLKYITGILAFFLIVVLFYWTYKFFAMFF